MSLSLVLTFDGYRVRMVGSRDCPEWIASDVCAVLGLAAVGRACARIPTPEKGVLLTHTPGGPQTVVTVKLPGLLRLILRSDKAEALRFQTWAVNEVLPAVLKHGQYPAPAVEHHAIEPLTVPDLDDPRSLRSLCHALVERRLLDQQELAIVRPKAAALDRLSSANGDVNLQDAGRVLGRQPNRFVAALIEDGLLFRGAHGKPEPYAQWREAGYFRVRISEVCGDAYLQTLVTPKGLAWLAGRYPQAVAALEVSH